MNYTLKYPYLNSDHIYEECVACEDGTEPDITRTKCTPIAEISISHGDAWGIGVMTYCLAGLYWRFILLMIMDHRCFVTT